MVDSTRLRYFAAVAETSSIRQAAELLHLTPAALSRAVKTLEDELGAALIAPRGRGIVLTDAGRRLADHARPVLAELGRLADHVHDREPEHAQLRYGSHESFGTYFSTTILRHCARTVELEHRYLVPGAIEQALRSGTIDAGVSYIPYPTSGVTSVEAGRIRMGIFGRPAMKARAFDDLEFAAPAGHSIDSPIRAQSLDGWPDATLARTIKHRVTHTETALEHCRSGRTVAYFPAFVVDLHNQRSAPRYKLEEIPAPKSMKDHFQPVYITTREGEEQSWQAQALHDAVRSIAEG